VGARTPAFPHARVDAPARLLDALEVRPAEPVPAEALRDFLGIARGLRGLVHDPVPRRRLEAAIASLETSMTLVHLPADTLGGRACRTRVDEACRVIGELVSVVDPAEPIVVEAQLAVLRR
jgi:hypothetical protein